jgi:hypothetical protein
MNELMDEFVTNSELWNVESIDTSYLNKKLGVLDFRNVNEGVFCWGKNNLEMQF